MMWKGRRESTTHEDLGDVSVVDPRHEILQVPPGDAERRCVLLLLFDGVCHLPKPPTPPGIGGLWRAVAPMKAPVKLWEK